MKRSVGVGFPLISMAMISISLVCAQQPGFISLDCGSEGSYTDSNGIQWTSDQRYIQTGETGNVSDAMRGVDRQLRKLRSFPNGKRNCYVLQPVEEGTKYLVRASFLYGNYDGRNSAPVFELLFGSNRWETVESKESTLPVVKEMISMSRSDSMSICLGRTKDEDTPFISSLELRPIGSSMYSAVNQTYSLFLWTRSDAGATSGSIRYPHDPFDRIWNERVWYAQSADDELLSINTTLDVSFAETDDEPPSAVMQTAITTDEINASLILEADFSLIGQSYHYLCFAEIEVLNDTSIREFNIMLDGKKWYGPVRPRYLASMVIFGPFPYYNDTRSFFLQRTNISTLGPIVNALEVYRGSSLKNGTYADDVEALTNVMKLFHLQKEWTGDPCLPAGYSWDWVKCRPDPPRITEVNLNNKGLSGTISPSFSNLSALVTLNLANNKLSGPIPENLAKLHSLKELNLANNKLSGPIPENLAKLRHLKELNLAENDLNGTVPEALTALLRNGNLRLSISGNPHLRVHKANLNKSLIVYWTIAVVALVALIAIAALVLQKMHRSKVVTQTLTGSAVPLGLKSKGSQTFTYAQVIEMTAEFEVKIGEGGYGPVFHGRLPDGLPVAVKILSEKSKQGVTEFSTEVDMLSKVHHKGLVSFIGYCNEAENMILIYEYMSNGNLRDLLSGKDASKPPLDWETRLRIALNAAQGLEYLHTGCTPSIIHRDIKSTNILLNERMEAKIGDFGLSKPGASDGGTHVSTAVKGTVGYLDPEYNISNQLNKKSDVYSFGVVIFEIITGWTPVIAEPCGDKVHIVSRIRSMLLKGNLEGIADPGLLNNYKTEVMWKVAELGLLCTAPQSIHRPSMDEVVLKLKESMRLQMSDEVADHARPKRKLDDQPLHYFGSGLASSSSATTSTDYSGLPGGESRAFSIAGLPGGGSQSQTVLLLPRCSGYGGNGDRPLYVSDHTPFKSA